MLALRSLLFVCLAFVGVACSGDDDEGADEPTCPELVERYRECDLIGEGELACREPATSVQRCVRLCTLEASCDDLFGSVCAGQDLGDAVISDKSQRCLTDCARDAETFTCDDGDEVPAAFRCDADDDCLDGSDEDDCGDRLFECDSGPPVPGTFRCDGIDDCGDGSDEDGCPAFECRDGTGEISEAWRCDFDDDCPDGSDESGCARRMCD